LKKIKENKGMEISANLVRQLRDKTGAGMMDCKKALAEANGDFEKAIELLRKRGIQAAEKKAGRATKQGLVTAYIHGEGKVGVLLEINCETDFVARNEQFKALCRDVSMHIAAAAPLYVRPEDVPADVIAKEKEIAIAQITSQGGNKPQAVLEKIAEGKINKYFEETCLMKQAFVKDPNKTIEQLLKEAIATLGENMTIRRFSRFVLGEGLSS
jgi:elongation factor Ts